ncbi:MAG: hypothetical protein BGO01_09135 [Armatimonadetes bacterium 55-13]|nr:hypothetical protein [Armatimonadota bacterium]OJU62176.1 MAG: hypothetical protein BGO01_09135 [Armatimonadetes bacterium 55-13]
MRDLLPDKTTVLPVAFQGAWNRDCSEETLRFVDTRIEAGGRRDSVLRDLNRWGISPDMATWLYSRVKANDKYLDPIPAPDLAPTWTKTDSGVPSLLALRGWSTLGLFLIGPLFSAIALSVLATPKTSYPSASWEVK